MSIIFSNFFQKINEIRPQEADFTEVLSSIAVTPKKLYFYGKLPKNGSKSGEKGQAVRPKTVAIVGSRKASKYGETIAFDLAKAVTERGAVVVSGLAYGIDAAAARGAVAAGGATVAVLGTPIDYIYPKTHVGLAEEILRKGGAVMSELGPGEEFHFKGCFLQRNRIIAGLADVVVIPEAAERSGSLNTAAHALEQGKEVFAVPGDITRWGSVGCNSLLRQGATPYLGIEDVLRALFPEDYVKRKSAKGAEVRGDTEAESVILKMMAQGESDGDILIERMKIEVVEFNRLVTLLEIKGRIRNLGCNQWQFVK